MGERSAKAGLAGGRAHHEPKVVQAPDAVGVARKHVPLAPCRVLEVAGCPPHLPQRQPQDPGPHPPVERERGAAHAPRECGSNYNKSRVEERGGMV